MSESFDRWLGRGDVGPPTDPEAAAPDPIQVTVDGMLCVVRSWTEAEWAALPEAKRPRHATHKPGVGWVGAVPVAGMN